MIKKIKEKLLTKNKYKGHPEAVIITCFFNPQNSPYRVKVFNQFYDTIKHLNHRVIECIVGDNNESQLPKSDFISVIKTSSFLWHKESLLNKIIKELPKEYKYIFWVDADLLFTNKNWVKDGVKALQTANIIQPFEYCVHLNKDETEPNVDYESLKKINNNSGRYKRMWRSFSANYSTTDLTKSHIYDLRGHVGFAWASRRDILEKVPLFDKSLTGGADSIMCYASAGYIIHNDIKKTFIGNLPEIEEWSHKFYKLIQGKMSYVKGDVFHLWHGDIEKRDYINRIRDFSELNNTITTKDENGLYITENGEDEYVKEYFKRREVGNDE